MVFHPLQDYVLIRRHEEAEQRQGGIIIPDTAKDKPQQGEVLAIGPGKRLDSGERRPMSVAVGHHILFGKYAGTDIRIDHEDLLILHESDILGVLDA
jgi:chaperonin GroES